MWMPTLRPSQVSRPTWAVSLPLANYHRRLQSDAHFIVPRKVEGWVNLCTADCTSQWLSRCMPLSVAWFKPGSLTLQPGGRPLDHCDLLGKWVWITCLRLLPNSARPRIPSPRHDSQAKCSIESPNGTVRQTDIRLMHYAYHYECGQRSKQTASIAHAIQLSPKHNFRTAKKNPLYHNNIREEAWTEHYHVQYPS